jgi:hypothetical protein
MSRNRNQRRGHVSAPITPTQGVETVASAALDTTTITGSAPPAPPEFHLDTNGAAPPPAPARVTIKLNRNYRPGGDFEVLGYWQDEVKVKNAAGQEVVVRPREFIKGEVAPPKLAGTGFANKLWAGTVIKVSKDEAKAIRAAEIGTVEVDDD